MEDKMDEGMFINSEGRLVFYLATTDHKGVYYVTGITGTDENKIEDICLALTIE